MTKWKKNFKFGSDGEDIVMRYLSEYWELHFESGEQNSIFYNMTFVEEVEGCEYLPERSFPFRRSPSLRFIVDGYRVDVIAPDLFVSKNNREKLYWIEVKRKHSNGKHLIIDKNTFEDYETLFNFTRNKFKIVCMTPSGKHGFNVYSTDMSSLISGKYSSYEKSGVIKYKWRIPSVMKKINKNPLLVSDFL